MQAANSGNLEDVQVNLCTFYLCSLIVATCEISGAHAIPDKITRVLNYCYTVLWDNYHIGEAA